MPRYNYKCKQCGHVAEHEHSFKETPEFLCLECEGSVMTKLIGAPGIAIKHGAIARRLRDQHVKEKDMRQDLLENHMVEKIAPVGAESIEQVYNEVKASGSMTKEKIQQTIEQNEAATSKKQKNWQIGANKRVKKRTLEKREKQAAEAAKKRAVSISTKK
jgi:putative FmdB family regulatory protein